MTASVWLNTLLARLDGVIEEVEWWSDRGMASRVWAAMPMPKVYTKERRGDVAFPFVALSDIPGEED